MNERRRNNRAVRAACAQWAREQYGEATGAEVAGMTPTAARTWAVQHGAPPVVTGVAPGSEDEWAARVAKDVPAVASTTGAEDVAAAGGPVGFGFASPDEARVSDHSSEARARLREDATGWEASLDGTETAAIESYTSAGFEDLNVALAYGDKLTLSQEATAGALSSALAKAGRADEPVTVWRGVAPPEQFEDGYGEFTEESSAVWAHQAFPVGETVQFDGFTSTSHSASVAESVIPNGGVLFEMRTAQGAYVGGATGRFGDMEQERLLDRGTRWRVVGVEDNVEFQHPHREEASERRSYHTVVYLVDESLAEPPAKGKAVPVPSPWGSGVSYRPGYRPPVSGRVRDLSPLPGSATVAVADRDPFAGLDPDEGDLFAGGDGEDAPWDEWEAQMLAGDDGDEDDGWGSGGDDDW